jgi:hypothetical protein
MILLKVSICERVTVNYAIEEEKGTDYYLGRISTGAKLRDFPEINSDAEFESLRYSLLTSGNIHAIILIFSSIFPSRSSQHCRL